jgi:LacI family transcriptional regulator
VAEAPFTEEGGFNGMLRLLNSTERPTGVAAASIAQSLGALAAIRRSGLEIPGDVSVVTFHDAPMAEYLDPPLTSIRMPLREMAEIAVDQVVRVIGGEVVHDIVVPTPPVLVERASTAPPR